VSSRCIRLSVCKFASLPPPLPEIRCGATGGVSASTTESTSTSSTIHASSGAILGKVISGAYFPQHFDGSKDDWADDLGAVRGTIS